MQMISSRTRIAVVILLAFSGLTVVLLYFAAYVGLVAAVGSMGGDEAIAPIRTAAVSALAGLLSSAAALRLLLKPLRSQLLRGTSVRDFIAGTALACLSAGLAFLHAVPLIAGLVAVAVEMV